MSFNPHPDLPAEPSRLRRARRILAWEGSLHPRLFRGLLRASWPWIREADGFVSSRYGPIEMRFNLLDPAERQGFLGTYDPPLRSLVQRFCEPGFTAIDVGANVGIIAATAAAAVGPNGHVLMVEPNPALCRRLEQLCRRNPLQNLHLFEAAVGTEPGTLPFYVSSAHTYSTLVKEKLPNYPLDRVVEVRVVQLAEVLARVPDSRPVHLLKVDAEGVDVSILLDVAPALRHRPVSVIVVEAFDERIDEVLSAYAALGYSAHALHPETHALHPWGSVRSANENLVLIHRSATGQKLLTPALPPQRP
jgi:FkbM family methyltransferase